MPSGSGPTSPTPSSEPSTSPAPSMLRSISHDPTSYVQRARVTRAAPPKPATNPMQFVQLKPCNLYQTAQEQLKRAEEVKKVKEVKKEDPEDWQCNLDNWKSSRRKRVEHIIDRVVEVKKYENMEEHERTRRKAKTFSEMLEERGSRGCKVPLPVYIEDDSNDFSDLGIGTSSASGKSSLSEDFDNHSVISDSQETEKSQLDIDNLSVNDNNGHRDYVSSPGYETSSSTAPASSPDPSEYTYEGAIQDYKLRISRAQAGCFGGISTSYNKNVTDTKPIAKNFVVKRQPGTKIEDRLLNFEVKGAADSNESSVKKDLPKVDILKRRELFEKENSDKLESNGTASNRLSGEFQNARSIKERMSSLVEKRIDDATDPETAAAKKANRLSGDITAIKERLNILEKQTSVVEKSKIDVPVGPLKDRLSSLNAHKEDEYPKDSYLLDFKTPHSYERNVVFNSADGFINGNKLYDVTTPTESITSKSEESDDFSELIQEQQQQAPPPPQPPVIMAEELKRVEQMEIITKPEIVDMIPLNIQTEQSNQVEDIDELLSPDELDQEDSVVAALDIALKEMDIEEATQKFIDVEIANAEIPIVKLKSAMKRKTTKREPIYEKIDDIDDLVSDEEVTVEKKNVMPITSKTQEKSVPIPKVVEEEEPYYQVPKPVIEPYYEVPSNKPVPLYENVNICFSSSTTTSYPIVNESKIIPTAFALGNLSILEPPKEKPPPPPVEEISDGEDVNADNEDDESVANQDPMKRMNSTKRIKKEIRNKRSSFLGLEDNADDDTVLELSVVAPPDISSFLKEERRLEKQLYIKTGLYDSYDTTESRDSGVSENHSRQSSEPITSSEEQDDHEEKPNMKSHDEPDGIVKPVQSQWQYNQNFRNENKVISHQLDEEARMRSLEDQIREQEEVLRVERELLQLEQEELRRQRENLLIRENLARHGDLIPTPYLMHPQNRRSLQDINATVNNIYVNTEPYNHQPVHNSYVARVDHRKSLPNLQESSVAINSEFNGNQYEEVKRMPPPIPPAKPLRSNLGNNQMDYQTGNRYQNLNSLNSSLSSLNSSIYKEPNQMMRNGGTIRNGMSYSQSIEDFSSCSPRPNYVINSSPYGNMSRNTLHALSAVPKPKYHNGWVQQQQQHQHPPSKTNPTEYYNRNSYSGTDESFLRRSTSKERLGDTWLALQMQKRKSDPQGFNYNKHWLIQEAEQRRIEQQRGVNGNRPSVIQRRGSNDNKPLPESIIETLTQRVQNRCNPTDRKRISNLETIPQNSSYSVESHREVLSVSGKKKCSHCNEELGRGAAMIIESLLLFYHLDCFKCCVCHVQLGDGVSGADVRVRNQKLHCQNCFSSDDGIKFSCV